MKKYKKILIGLGGILLGLIGILLVNAHNNIHACLATYDAPYTNKMLQSIEMKFNIQNTQRDVSKNIENGNYKFICIKSMGYSIPPLSQEKNKYFLNKYGYDCICYSDVIESEEQNQIGNKIYQYASKYNLLLLEELKKTSQ